ncbi:unnamed protein product, partial [Iphiclides podalirius]
MSAARSVVRASGARILVATVGTAFGPAYITYIALYNPDPPYLLHCGSFPSNAKLSQDRVLVAVHLSEAACGKIRAERSRILSGLCGQKRPRLYLGALKIRRLRLEQLQKTPPKSRQRVPSVESSDANDCRDQCNVVEMDRGCVTPRGLT